MGKHNGETHTCTICKKEYNNAKSLRDHKRKIHERSDEEKALDWSTCEICQKEFRRIYLKKHLKTHEPHEMSKKGKRKPKEYTPHSCEKCSKTFNFKSSLEKHLRAHETSEKDEK